MSIEEIIEDLKSFIDWYGRTVDEPYKDKKYQMAVAILENLKEKEELKVINENIRRELLSRTDKLVEKEMLDNESNWFIK